MLVFTTRRRRMRCFSWFALGRPHPM